MKMEGIRDHTPPHPHPSVAPRGVRLQSLWKALMLVTVRPDGKPVHVCTLRLPLSGQPVSPPGAVQGRVLARWARGWAPRKNLNPQTRSLWKELTLLHKPSCGWESASSPCGLWCFSSSGGTWPNQMKLTFLSISTARYPQFLMV